MNRDKHIWEGWTVGDFINDIEPTFNTIQDMVNRDKHIWEGWTVGDFIDDVEVTFNMCAPFHDKQSLKKWVAQEQPYYKKHIPEVYNYFLQKSGL